MMKAGPHQDPEGMAEVKEVVIEKKHRITAWANKQDPVVGAVVPVCDTALDQEQPDINESDLNDKQLCVEHSHVDHVIVETKIAVREAAITMEVKGKTDQIYHSTISCTFLLTFTICI